MDPISDKEKIRTLRSALVCAIDEEGFGEASQAHYMQALAFLDLASLAMSLSASAHLRGDP
jgi:hypothetical protein